MIGMKVDNKQENGQLCLIQQRKRLAQNNVYAFYRFKEFLDLQIISKRWNLSI